jgi:transcriptional regulator with GAF, ATPase, and Fis domain
MNEKQLQVKSLIEYLNDVEAGRLLSYCRRQFPEAYKRTLVMDAPSIRAVDAALANVRDGKSFSLRKIMDKIEYDILHRALIRFKKQTRAAEFLGLKEQTLRYKMIRLKIPTIREHRNYYMQEQTDIDRKLK